MNLIDALLDRHRTQVARPSTGGLPLQPSSRVAVVACMDARLPVERLLGLEPGEAQVLRNAGGIVTDDVLRSLVVATRMQGTREVMVIGHTDCGLQRFTDEQLRAKLQRELLEPVDPHPFYTFRDVEQNVRWQVQKVYASRLIPPDIRVRGFVYDLHEGRLEEVEGPQGRRATARVPDAPPKDNVRHLVVHTRLDAEG